MKGHDHGPSAGYAPGANPIASKILGLLAGRGRGKKSSTRTPLEPRQAPTHPVHRWRSDGRARLVLEAIRLGVLDSSKRPVGTWREGGQYRSWKSLTAAVERARPAGYAEEHR